jgi:class 3 adenylate cyclase
MFCDIAGFTAWSSTREPAQVFILLQTVYQAFDKIAKRRKVFKVETIGDSYGAHSKHCKQQSFSENVGSI